MIFNFKHKVRNWLGEAEVDRNSEKSIISKSSRNSKSSSDSSSGSLKSRLAEEKSKLAEIAAEAKYVEKKQELQCCAKKLGIEEKLPKAEARLKALEEMEKYHAEGKNQESNYPEQNCNMLHNPLDVFRNPAEQMFSSKTKDSRKTKEEIKLTEESTKNISGYDKNQRRIPVDQFHVPYYSSVVPRVCCK